ncbi:MAG: SpoIIE family protein phosphatase, partial [Anaerolineales bacterium]|nr:SpoIIE family protein phosphatase [Anaerolineales bacterium]
LDEVKNVLDYDAAGIFVLNQDLVHARHEAPREMIAGVSRRGFDPGPVEQDEMLMHGRGITGYVILNSQSVIIPDVRLDPRYVQGRQKTLSEIAVPIILNERTIGALNLESDRLSTFTVDDVEVLQFFADAAAISLEKAMLHKQLLEQELISKQLETAREVQSRLIPRSAPSLCGYDLAGVCIPADQIGGDYFDYIPLTRKRDQIGGDYFDYIPLTRKRFGLAIADVSGHGIASALVMTAFRALLRTKARGRLGPAQIARTINHLLPEFTGNNHFITLLYAILEVPSGRLTYTSCGHPPPLLLRAGGKVEQLAQNHTALGIFPNLHFTDAHVLLNPGDILALYTDGVTELANRQGEAFGMPRLVQVIRENRTLAAAEMVQQVIEAAQAFAGSSGFLDDLTLVIVRREPC